MNDKHVIEDMLSEFMDEEKNCDTNVSGEQCSTSSELNDTDKSSGSSSLLHSSSSSSSSSLNDNEYDTTNYEQKTKQYYNKMGFFEMMSAVYFTLSSCYICGVEYMKYKIGWKTQNNAIIDIAKRLANKNMLYVKVFQSFATNRTILNEDLNLFFMNYTDNVDYTDEEYDINDLKELERASLQQHPYQQLQIDDNYKPYKSGLMSLIFKGKLLPVNTETSSADTLPTPTPVIIKYLRKNIHKNFNSSMNNLVLFAKLTKKIPYLRTLNIESLILQNIISMKDQICFQQEVKNIQEFYKSWSDCEYVKIPFPYSDYTEKVNPNIIVMEYIEGKKIAEIAEEDNGAFAKILASFNVRAGFCNKIYHGDLHPGNILFIKDEIRKSDGDHIITTPKYKIGIIDFGIIGHVSRGDQDVLFTTVKLLFQKKFKRLVKYIVSDLSEDFDETKPHTNEPFYIKHLTDKQYGQLLNDLHHAVTVYATPKIKYLGVSEMYNVNFILNSYGLAFKRTLYKLFITVAIMDAIGNQLGSEESYIQYSADVVIDLFGLDIGDCKDDE